MPQLSGAEPGSVNRSDETLCVSVSFAKIRSCRLSKPTYAVGFPSVGFLDQRFIADINQHRMVLEVKPRQKTWRLRPWPIVPG